jgi:hypothetical protein
MKRVSICVARTIFYVGMGFPLVGCVAAMRMPEPSLAMSAKLRYVTTSAPGYTHFWRIGQEGCPKAVKREHIAGTGPGPLIMVDGAEASKVQMLGSSTNPEKYVRERLIPAGKPLYYELNAESVAVQYVPGFSCTNAGVFMPRTGAEYELTYNVTYMGQECSVRVVELVSGAGGQVERVPVHDWKVFYPARNDKDYCSVLR